MISTSLLFKIFRRRSQLFMTKRHQWRTYWRLVQTYSGVYLCKRMIFWTFRPNPNVCLRFCDKKKIKWFLLRVQSDLLEISSKDLYFYITHCRLDWIVQIKFGLRPEWPDIWSDLEDQTEFWTDLEDKTERLSSLEKFMQIRTQTEVWSVN